VTDPSPAASARPAWLLPALVVGGLTLVMFAVGMALSDPPPPKRIRIATGGPGGAYAKYGEELKTRLERWGLEVELVNTQGSVENYHRLAATDDSAVDVAFVQGGVVREAFPELAEAEVPPVTAVGALYTEPLWLFFRQDQPIDLLGDLRGKTIHVGPPGSGTAPVAELLLSKNGVSENNSTLEHLPDNTTARDQLVAGKIDAMFVIASPDAPLVRDLLGSDGVRLFDFLRYVAYGRQLRFLSRVELAQGIVNLERNLPKHDVSLLGPRATLACRADVHPRVAVLCAKAAHEVFGPGNIVDPPGAYPSLDALDLPVSPAAEEYQRHGEGWLARNLPFWALRLVSQLKLVLLPLITILLPALKILPAVAQARLQMILNRHYKDLRGLEGELGQARTQDRAQALVGRLIDLRKRVQESGKSLTGKSQLPYYDLRLHVDLVLGDAREQADALSELAHPTSRRMRSPTIRYDLASDSEEAPRLPERAPELAREEGAAAAEEPAPGDPPPRVDAAD
jgi:uncharacterized protein